MTQAASISDPVRQLAQQIAKKLDNINSENTAQCSQTDSLVYIGHWQDAIPRAIWVDPVLDAIDVRCWGIIRTQALVGSAVILSLHRLLQNQLGYSKPTVSKVLYVLRLTRWISLCSKLRSESGEFKGHIYAIHDAPISITDAIYLDKGYITFVKQQRQHHHQQIKRIADNIWQALNHSIASQEAFLDEQGATPTIRNFFRQVNGQDQVNLFNSNHQVNLFNLAKYSQVNKINLGQVLPESIENQSLNGEVKQINPNGLYTTTTTSCSSSFNNKTTTTPASKRIEQSAADTHSSNLIFPPDFNASEQELAQLYLKQVAPDLQQKFLDETGAQIEAKLNTSKPIRNPVAYLGWLCNEQAKGNTLLTSLSIRYRDNRERKIRTEQQITKKQQEMAGMNSYHSSSHKEGKPTQRLRDALIIRRKDQ